MGGRGAVENIRRASVVGGVCLIVAIMTVKSFMSVDFTNLTAWAVSVTSAAVVPWLPGVASIGWGTGFDPVGARDTVTGSVVTTCGVGGGRPRFGGGFFFLHRLIR